MYKEIKKEKENKRLDSWRRMGGVKEEILNQASVGERYTNISSFLNTSKSDKELELLSDLFCLIAISKNMKDLTQDKIFLTKIIEVVMNCTKEEITSASGEATDYFMQSEKRIIVTANALIGAIFEYAIVTNTQNSYRIIDKLSEKETITMIRTILKEKNIEEIPELIKEIVWLIDNSKEEDFDKIRTKLPEILKTIKNEYNITHFGRFSAKFLEYLHLSSISSSMEKEKIPLYVYVYSYSDSNNAFYKLSKQIDELLNHGTVIAIEAKHDYELEEMIKKTSQKFGKIDHLFIVAHGSPLGLKLEDDFSLSSLLNVSDVDIMKNIGDSMNEENPERSIILIACESGKEEEIKLKKGNLLVLSMANFLAKFTGVKVIAPPAIISDYTVKIVECEGKKQISINYIRGLVQVQPKIINENYQRTEIKEIHKDKEGIKITVDDIHNIDLIKKNPSNQSKEKSE
ncbi:MAG: hypothetical protein QXE90_00720 [Candidatus Micrarchaeia archaeon]